MKCEIDIDMGEMAEAVASHIEAGDVAMHVDVDAGDVAEHVDMHEVASHIDIDSLAESVIDKVGDDVWRVIAEHLLLQAQSKALQQARAELALQQARAGAEQAAKGGAA